MASGQSDAASTARALREEMASKLAEAEAARAAALKAAAERAAAELAAAKAQAEAALAEARDKAAREMDTLKSRWVVLPFPVAFHTCSPFACPTQPAAHA